MPIHKEWALLVSATGGPTLFQWGRVDFMPERIYLPVYTDTPADIMEFGDANAEPKLRAVQRVFERRDRTRVHGTVFWLYAEVVE